MRKRNLVVHQPPLHHLQLSSLALVQRHHHRRHLPRHAPRVVDHRTPQRPRIPPSRIRRLVPKRHDNPNRRPEQCQRNMRHRHPVPVQYLVRRYHRKVIHQQDQERPSHIRQHSRHMPLMRNDHALSPSVVTARNTRPPSSEILTSPLPMSYTQPEIVSSSLAIAPATDGCVRRCCICSSTFSSVSRRINSLGFSSLSASEFATLNAACAFFSQLFTVGIFSRLSGFSRPFIAPQSECPHTTTCCTFSAVTAYSITALTPPIISPYAGTRFPTLRVTNKSPGPDCVIISGSIRESAHVTNNACGVCGSLTAFT